MAARAYEQASEPPRAVARNRLLFDDTAREGDRESWRRPRVEHTSCGREQAFAERMQGGCRNALFDEWEELVSSRRTWEARISPFACSVARDGSVEEALDRTMDTQVINQDNGARPIACPQAPDPGRGKSLLALLSHYPGELDQTTRNARVARLKTDRCVLRSRADMRACRGGARRRSRAPPERGVLRSQRGRPARPRALCLPSGDPPGFRVIRTLTRGNGPAPHVRIPAVRAGR
jgi:hypothetical protein